MTEGNSNTDGIPIDWEEAEGENSGIESIPDFLRMIADELENDRFGDDVYPAIVGVHVVNVDASGETKSTVPFVLQNPYIVNDLDFMQAARLVEVYNKDAEEIKLTGLMEQAERGGPYLEDLLHNL